MCVSLCYLKEKPHTAHTHNQGREKHIASPYNGIYFDKYSFIIHKHFNNKSTVVDFFSMQHKHNKHGGKKVKSLCMFPPFVLSCLSLFHSLALLCRLFFRIHIQIRSANNAIDAQPMKVCKRAQGRRLQHIGAEKNGRVREKRK